MNPPQTRSITEWIGVFQWEEYGSQHADIQQGRAMAHFNDFLARHGELPSKVSKRSRMVTAPIGELKGWHLRRFLTWFIARETPEDVGKNWYAPTLAKFVEWLKDNKAVTDAQHQELLMALTEIGANIEPLH